MISLIQYHHQGSCTPNASCTMNHTDKIGLFTCPISYSASFEHLSFCSIFLPLPALPDVCLASPWIVPPSLLSSHLSLPRPEPLDVTLSLRDCLAAGPHTVDAHMHVRRPRTPTRVVCPPTCPHPPAFCAHPTTAVAGLLVLHRRGDACPFGEAGDSADALRSKGTFLRSACMR